MKRDKFKHRRHADDVNLEPVDATHAVLTDHTVQTCPVDGCRYFELGDDWELDHDVEPSLDVEARLDELAQDVDLPVFQVYHCSGMLDPKKAFRTKAEAAAWTFGHYGGSGNANAGPGDIRKTYSRTAGSHSQRARKKDYPMVFAVVNTALDPDDWGRVPYANLVPRPDDYPDSAQWKATPSVLDVFQYHLDPPDHIVTGRYGETEYHIPDGYDGDALQWFVEQVAHYEVVVQTPDLFLDDDAQQIAAEHATDWTPPRGDA